MLLKNITKILPLIGIAILIYLIIKTGPVLLIETVLSINVMYLLPAIALYILYILVQSVKWGYLVKKQGMHLGLWPLFKIYVIGGFYGIITPGRIGTFIRVRYVKRRTGKGTGESSVSVLIDKALDLIVIFSLATIGLLGIINHINFELLTVVSALYIMLFLGIIVVVRRKTSRKIFNVFWRMFIPASMKEMAKENFNSFYDSLIEKKHMTVPFLLSVLGLLILYSSTYMIAISLGININYTTFVTILPIATLIGIMPITVGGWGTREATLVILFSIFAVSENVVIVMSMVSAGIGYLLMMTLGTIFAFSEERRNSRWEKK